MACTRRAFIGASAAAVVYGALRPRAFAEQTSPAVADPEVWVIHGGDAPTLLDRGIERLGGWKVFFRPGAKVTLKVNAAWGSRPDQGGNTAPELVGAAIERCRSEGASEVALPEKSCTPSDVSFEMSGIAAAAGKAGGRLYALDDKRFFRSVDVPQGERLKQADLAVDVLDTDCLINMPVAKSHGSATLTIGMKNWMGSVDDRGFWHRNDLHQCIADCCTVIKPALTIVDATRIMLTKGPRGPGKMAYPRQLILSRDFVAADAYAATLFDKDPMSIGYLRRAHERGMGCADLKQAAVRHVETA